MRDLSLFFPGNPVHPWCFSDQQLTRLQGSSSPHGGVGVSSSQRTIDDHLDNPPLYTPRDTKVSTSQKAIDDHLDNPPLRTPRDIKTSTLEEEAIHAIRRIIHAQLENAPVRLINTSNGRLCDRDAQIHAFTESKEYEELLYSLVTHAPLQMEPIEEVVIWYFGWVMLSHRWESNEPLLHDIQDKVVYNLNPVGTVVKLQSFCRVARDAGYHWAWSDTCCIDRHSNTERQRSVNCMFAWYHYSALTIVYLSDVAPSSKSGALAESAWNTRGWTILELLAPKVILFYQADWTPYLDIRSPNHKESVAIMQELHDSTGINAQALTAFRPGTRDAREKLQWASSRVTMLQEDIAYSLFGIFDVHLPVIYGERKQNALGRLLQEIIAISGDISALDWVGKSSEFNSCLPADISSYKAPSCTLPSLSEDDMQKSVSMLQNTVAVESALKLHALFNQLSAVRFAHRRLHLPCIVFPLTEVKPRPDQDGAGYFTYGVKADGLQDLLVTTEDVLVQFSLARRRTQQTFLLIHPWTRYLLRPHDFAELADIDDGSSVDDYRSAPESSEEVDSDSSERAIRLIARLGQPFNAFLLVRQRSGEYKRIASDHNIIAQIRDVPSLDNIMDVRTLEIL